MRQGLEKDRVNRRDQTDLSDVYRDYIGCLNKQDWQKFEQFVHDEVYYNGQQVGLLGYREMLENDFYKIPDLYFAINTRALKERLMRH